MILVFKCTMYLLKNSRRVAMETVQTINTASAYYYDSVTTSCQGNTQVANYFHRKCSLFRLNIMKP
jgi:hypothetical protein